MLDGGESWPAARLIHTWFVRMNTSAAVRPTNQTIGGGQQPDISLCLCHLEGWEVIRQSVNLNLVRLRWTVYADD